MRTTIDISENLLRQARARAALEGTRMTDVVNRALTAYLAVGDAAGAGEAKLPQHVKSERVGRFKLPIVESKQPGASQADLETLKNSQAGEDQERHASVFGR